MKKIVTLLSIGFTWFAQAQAPSFQWAKQLKNNGSNFTKPKAIAVDAAGNVYTTGFFQYNTDFDPGVGTYTLSNNPDGYEDIYVSKLDANGNFLWAKSFGGPQTDIGWDLKLDASGNPVILCAVGLNVTDIIDFDPSPTATYTIDASVTHLVALKLNPAGDFIWAKGIPGVGNYNESNLTIDNMDNIIIAGGYGLNTADFDPSPTSTYTLAGNPGSNLFILKLNSAGNFLWAKSCATVAGFAPKAQPGSIITDATGNVIVTGRYYETIDFDPSSTTTFTMAPPSNVTNGFILKLNSLGDFVWAKNVADGSQGQDIITDASGNIYSTGQFSGAPDFDPSPTATLTLLPSSSETAYVLKYDASGNLVWAKSFKDVFAATGRSNGYGISLDNQNNVFTTGYFNGTIDFDPGVPEITGFCQYGNKDTYISKLTNNGDFVLYQDIGQKTGPGNDCVGADIHIDATNNVYVTGFFRNVVDFDASATSASTLLATASSDSYILKINAPAMVGVKEYNLGLAFSVYPNPTTGILNLKLEPLNENATTIEITNTLGQVVLSKNITENITQLNVSEFVKGIYFVSVKAEGKTTTQKLIVN